MKVSNRVAKFLKSIGYDIRTIDEYWVNDGTLHTYLEGEMMEIKPEFRISAPSPYEALLWLWETKQVNMNLKSDNLCVCSATIPHRRGMTVEISGDNPDGAMNNCLELIAKQW